MSDNVTLDRIDFEKLKQQAKLARAEYMRQCGTVFIKSRHTHRAIAVVAVLLISFGVKMFFLSAPIAEAGTRFKYENPFDSDCAHHRQFGEDW